MPNIQLRHDTAENWTTANPTLLAGEAGIETDTGKMKVGDGATAWTDLAYLSSGEETSSSYTDLTDKPSINGVTLTGNKTTSDLDIDIPDSYTKTETDSLLEAKQDTLTDSQLLAVNSGVTTDTVNTVGTLDTEMSEVQTNIANIATVDTYSYSIQLAPNASTNTENSLNGALTTSGNLTVQGYLYNTNSSIYTKKGYLELYTTSSNTPLISVDTSSLTVNGTSATSSLLYAGSSYIYTKPGVLHLGKNNSSNSYARINGYTSGTSRQMLNITSSIYTIGNNSTSSILIGPTVTLGNTSTTNLKVTLGSTVSSIPIAEVSMPSTRYVSVTLPSSGSTFTAPADGWLIIRAQMIGDVNSYIDSYITNDDISDYCGGITYIENFSGDTFSAMYPLKANDVVHFSYSTTFSVQYCRFFYAAGATS